MRNLRKSQKKIPTYRSNFCTFVGPQLMNETVQYSHIDNKHQDVYFHIINFHRFWKKKNAKNINMTKTIGCIHLLVKMVILTSMVMCFTYATFAHGKVTYEPFTYVECIFLIPWVKGKRPLCFSDNNSSSSILPSRC